MPSQPKPKKVGRPKLPKGAAKGKAVQVRFTVEDFRRVTGAAKASKQTVSEWIRSTLNAALES
jgi:predicted HicB family RNase H-like nuclease